MDICIVGSVDTERIPALSLDRPEQGTELAEEIGRQLAQRGHRIVVYSAAPTYLECHVVRGYVESGLAKPGSIRVLTLAAGASDLRFAESTDHPELFEWRYERAEGWEAAFYRSLRDHDGVVVVGGADSTYIAGMVALAVGSPLLAITAFGGAARKVWEQIRPDQDLPSAQGRSDMASAPSPEMVGRWLNELEKQRRAAGRRTVGRSVSRIATTPMAATYGVMAALVFAMPVGYVLDRIIGGPTAALDDGGRGFSFAAALMAVLVFVLPVVAGIAGASLRTVLLRHEALSMRQTLLGAVAGGSTGLLFVLAQCLSNPFWTSFTVLVFGIIAGALGGFTLDQLLKGRAIAGEVRRGDDADAARLL